MSNLEFNKVFAAVLVAGITAMLAGFVAEKLVHPHELEENAVFIDGGAVAEGGGAEKASGPEPILHLIAAADVAKGEKLSKACAACHAFEKGGPNKVGPGLWNVVGAAKGHHAGFAYSEALIAHGGTWSYQDLNQFLWKPKSLIDGTKMNFIGLKKPEDRAAMIAWLRTMADSPAALPSQGEMDAEMALLGPKEPEGAPSGAAEPSAEGGSDADAVTAQDSASGESSPAAAAGASDMDTPPEAAAAAAE